MPSDQLDRENAVVSFLDCANPAAWLAFMRWATPELIKKDQRLLAELVCREAHRRQQAWPGRSARLLTTSPASSWT